MQGHSPVASLDKYIPGDLVLLLTELEFPIEVDGIVFLKLRVAHPHFKLTSFNSLMFNLPFGNLRSIRVGASLWLWEEIKGILCPCPALLWSERWFWALEIVHLFRLRYFFFKLGIVVLRVLLSSS